MDDAIIDGVPSRGDIEVTELLCDVSDRSLQQSGDVNRVGARVH